MIESILGKDFVLHHVGIAVPNLQNYYQGQEIITDHQQGVNIKFEMLGNVRLELLQPTDENSFIYQSSKNKQKVLHLCFEVNDLDTALAQVKKIGFHVLRYPVSTNVFPGQRITWLFHPIYGLIELLS